MYDLFLQFLGTVFLDRLVLHAAIAGVATLAVVLCDPALPDVMRPLPAGLITVYDSLVSLGVVLRAAALDCDEWHELVRHWRRGGKVQQITEERSQGRPNPHACQAVLGLSST